MNAFSNAGWKLARADAFETEAEALDDAASHLNAVIPMLDEIQKRAIQATAELLRRERDKRRESAAVLRSAA